MLGPIVQVTVYELAACEYLSAFIALQKHAGRHKITLRERGGVHMRRCTTAGSPVNTLD